MTNNEILLEKAIDALNAGKLDSYERKFVESIEHYTKKDLRKLSSKQYEQLARCAKKAD